ncbi:MAG: hypothetical protein SGARI_007227 [Bacillariaceae sp.]
MSACRVSAAGDLGKIAPLAIMQPMGARVIRRSRRAMLQRPLQKGCPASISKTSKRSQETVATKADAQVDTARGKDNNSGAGHD